MPELFAPAKINLTLEVLARRPDGYHALRSVMLPVALYDRLSWEPAARFSFSVGDRALVDDNLVVRAFQALGLGAVPFSVRLEKQVPVGGGLGGGSSDAATVLRAAAQGAFGELGAHEYLAIARRLGSDVPFFLADGPALVEGTGERVTALGQAPPWWVVLYVPAVAVSTKLAYETLDAARERDGYASRPRAGSASLRVLEAVQRADFGAVVAEAQNDFEAAIAPLYPPIAAALHALRAAGAPLAMLSGSGACCFALADGEAQARAIAAKVQTSSAERCLVAPLHHGTTWRA